MLVRNSASTALYQTIQLSYLLSTAFSSPLRTRSHTFLRTTRNSLFLRRSQSFRRSRITAERRLPPLRPRSYSVAVIRSTLPPHSPLSPPPPCSRLALCPPPPLSPLSSLAGEAIRNDSSLFDVRPLLSLPLRFFAVSSRPSAADSTALGSARSFGHPPPRPSPCAPPAPDCRDSWRSFSVALLAAFLQLNRIYYAYF